MDDVELNPDDSNLILDDGTDKEETYIRFVNYYSLILTTAQTVPILVTTGLYVFMLVKFKKLRTRQNVVLTQVFFCISACTFLALVTCFDVLYFSDNRAAAISEILLYCNLVFFQVSILLMLFLILDWFITVTPCRFKDKYQKNYPWILGIIYVNSIVNVTLDFLLERYLFTFHVYLSTPFVLIISSILAVILGLVYKCVNYNQEIRKTSYRLTISLTYLLLWSSHLILTFLIYTCIAIQYTFMKAVILIVIEKFLTFLLVLYAVFMFFWLIKRDDHLKACFEHTLKRSVRQYMRNEDLDVDSTSSPAV